MAFYSLVAVWIARMVIMAGICTFLGWLGIRILDALTPKIHEREEIGKNPIATGMFIAGFIIFIGLVIHGSSIAPIALGGPIIEMLIDFRKLALVSMCFFASLLFGVLVFNIVDKLTPKIPFQKIGRSEIGTGIYVFGYLIFLGLILHAALATPL